MAQKSYKSPDDFWRDYEEQVGEKVLARSMGQYRSGWEEFETDKTGPLWGLLIVTSGGFRFHHFPQTSWLDAIFRAGSGAAAQQEKTIFIPLEKITAVEFRIEKRWWKKILSPTQPELVIRYQNSEGIEKELHAESESIGVQLAGELQKML
jgi:hypothetical protein